MNKDISRSPKKHEFLLNLARSPPLTIDHFDYNSVNPHSKESAIEEDDHHSFHKDVLTTDHFSIKNPILTSQSTQNRKSHAKKKSFDLSKDAVTHQLAAPSSTSNAKLLNKSSQSRPMNKSSTSKHLNFLSSKEFAKFALSKVLTKENRKEKPLHLELSPQSKGSKPTSLEKVSPKTFLKESIQTKLANHLQSSKKKQNAKLRNSNLTYNDLSSLLDQSRHIHSFINSPQKRGTVQPTLTSTKSTSNLRPPSSTKNTVHTTKNSWLPTSNEPFKGLEISSTKNQQLSQEARHKERSKGIQSIVSILNLRRDKKHSPDKNANSCYQPSSNHRKVASIGGQGNGNTLNMSASQTKISSVNVQEDNNKKMQKNPSFVKKTTSSPLKKEKEPSPPKQKDMLEDEIVLNEKEMQYEYFTGLRTTFDSLLEKYKSDIENAHESYNLMNKIKQAYESFITELLTNQEKTKDLARALLHEDNGLKYKYDSANQQKILLEEIQYLKAENQRLQYIINNKRDRFDPYNSEESRDDYSNKILKAPAEPSERQSVTPKQGEYLERVYNESENMKRMLAAQQHTLNAMRYNEEKMWRLLYAVRKRGLDLERIYREEVQGPVSTLNLDPILPASSGNLDSEKNSNEKRSNAGAPSHMEILSLCSLGENLSDMTDVMPEIKDLLNRKNIADAKTTDTTPYLPGMTNNLGVNTAGKTNMRLDFTGLPNQTHHPKPDFMLPFENGNVIQQPDHGEPIGFHDEFMSKLAEFSLSWRQAAMNQRNF